MPTKDTQLINAFLSEFVEELAARFPKDIDFILLFGSAARGEFRAGISDVDLIIQVKDDRFIAPVERHAEKIFWILDAKHKTRLVEVCSTKRDDIFSGLEKQAKLYMPFEVIGPQDINWKGGKIASPGLGAFALIAPIYQFAKKLKKEGKILYGRDILSEICIRQSLFDKVKAIAVPYLLSIAALPISLVMPDRGLKYSIKAILYSAASQIEVLDRSYGRTSFLNTKILRAELGELYSIRLAKEAMHAKRDYERIKKEWSYIDKAAFCFQAPIYIFYNNLLSLISAL